MSIVGSDAAGCTKDGEVEEAVEEAGNDEHDFTHVERHVVVICQVKHQPCNIKQNSSFSNFIHFGSKANIFIIKVIKPFLIGYISYV